MRFNLTLAAPRGMDEAGAVRLLKAALKTLLRRFQLRAVRLEPAAEQAEAAPPSTNPEPRLETIIAKRGIAITTSAG